MAIPKMAICPKGHYYDGSLSECPFCSSKTIVDSPEQKKHRQVFCPKGHAYDSSLSECPYCLSKTIVETEIIVEPPPPPRVRPVVGWLVCLQGPDTGKDFRLHTDFNRVGRNENQDVCLSDATVSREHFRITHDRVHNHYFAEMNKGVTVVYINNYPLGERALLKKGDQIKVGNTLLVFLPLEEEYMKWNWTI